MTTYISLLAQDLLRRFGTDMSRVAVVFPNKRASLFLNQELARQSALQSKDVLWSPSYITISDLFRRHSDLEVADQILLVCRLYDVFCRCTGIETETLDHFFNWGVLLLSDFDDLDKNMADARKVFSIVGEHHELDNDDYLTDNQREALKEFFHTFNDGHSTMLREKFLQLWSKLFDIYDTFRTELRQDHLAYEGMLYRDVCEQEGQEFEYDCYCFVGFNMLQQVEQQLFARLKLQGKALFYWDYDPYYLKTNHEAGHFISDYLGRFPNAMPATMEHGTFFKSKGDITYISATTENLQARYVHDWLLEKDRWKDGAQTAIVMADEHLLQTIIRSLPDEVKDVNITTGYPLSQSPIVSLLQHLIELQTEGRVTGTEKYRLRNVNNVLHHPFARYISDQSQLLYQRLNGDKIYFPSFPLPLKEDDEPGTFCDEGLTMLFCPDNGITDNISICQWLMQIVKHIAITINRQKEPSTHNSALDAEALFRTYQILQRLLSLLCDGTLAVDIVTFRRLLMQIIQTTTVPYHGEPVAGIQIMGVLETRCLDFKHLLVLSCNEGNMPKGVNDSSFIPHSVRQAYGMTTVEHKVGIYSYYFHRLLQRTEDATLSYNSSTEGLNTGEMSRFMLQLLVESGLNIVQRNLITGQLNDTDSPQAIVKDEQIMRRIHEKFFGLGGADGAKRATISPSSLSTYLRCQLRYYYQHILNLREEEDDIDEMDNRMFGNIFHKAAEVLYNMMKDKNGWIYEDVIKRTLKDKGAMARCVDQAFREELFHIKDSTFLPEYNGLQLINRKVILKFMEDLLRYDLQHTPLKIVGTEIWVSIPVPIPMEDNIERTCVIGGIIDRLDMVGKDVTGYTMRVLDYKTGATEPGKMDSVEDVFLPENISKHADYYLQTMLYSYIIGHDNKNNPKHLPVSPGLLYVQKLRHNDYSPTLSIADEPITDMKKHEETYVAMLQRLIKDICNPQLDFTPTEDCRRCQYCPFSTMCGI